MLIFSFSESQEPELIIFCDDKVHLSFYMYQKNVMTFFTHFVNLFVSDPCFVSLTLQKLVGGFLCEVCSIANSQYTQNSFKRKKTGSEKNFQLRFSFAEVLY